MQPPGSVLNPAGRGRLVSDRRRTRQSPKIIPATCTAIGRRFRRVSGSSGSGVSGAQHGRGEAAVSVGRSWSEKSGGLGSEKIYRSYFQVFRALARALSVGMPILLAEEASNHSCAHNHTRPLTQIHTTQSHAHTRTLNSLYIIPHNNCASAHMQTHTNTLWGRLGLGWWTIRKNSLRGTSQWPISKGNKCGVKTCCGGPDEERRGQGSNSTHRRLGCRRKHVSAAIKLLLKGGGGLAQVASLSGRKRFPGPPPPCGGDMGPGGSQRKDQHGGNTSAPHISSTLQPTS